MKRRKRSVKFEVVARFTGGAPSEGWLVVEPGGVVTVRKKRGRHPYTSTLDGLANLVIWRAAQAQALEKARQRAVEVAERRRDRRLRAQMRVR